MVYSTTNTFLLTELGVIIRQPIVILLVIMIATTRQALGDIEAQKTLHDQVPKPFLPVVLSPASFLKADNSRNIDLFPPVSEMRKSSVTSAKVLSGPPSSSKGSLKNLQSSITSQRSTERDKAGILSQQEFPASVASAAIPKFAHSVVLDSPLVGGNSARIMTATSHAHIPDTGSPKSPLASFQPQVGARPANSSNRPIQCRSFFCRHNYR